MQRGPASLAFRLPPPASDLEMFQRLIDRVDPLEPEVTGPAQDELTLALMVLLAASVRRDGQTGIYQVGDQLFLHRKSFAAFFKNNPNINPPHLLRHCRYRFMAIAPKRMRLGPARPGYGRQPIPVHEIRLAPFFSILKSRRNSPLQGAFVFA